MSCPNLKLRLHIETDRWSKPRITPLNERTCINCNIREDEFHFVLECKLFTDIHIGIFQYFIEIILVCIN